VGRTPFPNPRHRTRIPPHQTLGRKLTLRLRRRTQRTLLPRPGQMHLQKASKFLCLLGKQQPRPILPQPDRLHSRLHHSHRHLVHPPSSRPPPSLRYLANPRSQKLPLRPIPRSLALAQTLALVLGGAASGAPFKPAFGLNGDFDFFFVIPTQKRSAEGIRDFDFGWRSAFSAANEVPKKCHSDA
jgi:hypothetical protein